MTVSAPINVNLKCSASYFDHENLVDTNKNIKIGQSRQEANTIERVNRRNRVHDDIEEEAFKEERGELDNGAGLFMQSEHLESIRDISRDVTSRSPLQVSLWGRSLHRVDSYSIVQGLHADTHMYVSEASTGEEAISMFSMDIPEASGNVTIWRDLRQVEDVEMDPVSRFKLYSPTNFQDKNGISMVFRTPILMNRIYLWAKEQGSIDLNGLLMDKLYSIGLTTDIGNIKVSDIWAGEIKLASNTGDVMCYGTLEGNVSAVTLGDGDFTARSVVGPQLDVFTDRGDICVWDDCHSETTQLITNTGNITCNRLYSDAKICIKTEGVATLNIISGSVGCVVKNGNIISHIDELTQDSFMEVETGNVIIHIPAQSSRNFRVSLVSPRSLISPHVLNSGEFYVKDGLEHFVTGETGEGDLAPCLTVRCHEGSVSLQSPPVSRSIDTGDESEDGSQLRES